MVEQNRQPKWKADTYCIPMHNGVYLRGNNSRLVLKGKSLYPLLKYLIPHLNGNVTLEQITKGLDADRKRMVVNLIEKLFTHHFLTDSSQDRPDTLCPLEREHYAPNIAFIQSFQTSAASRFEDFRDKHFLIIGDEPDSISLIQAGLQCGIKYISVISTSECKHFCPSLLANEVTTEDVCLLEAPSWDDEAQVRAIIQAYDAILHIAHHHTVARAQLVNRLCIEERKTLIQAVTMNDYAWIGPLVSPKADVCWECAWRRLQANLTASDQYIHPEFHDGSLDYSNQPSAALKKGLIANHLLFELFRYYTQVSPTETGRRLRGMDLRTFESESHTFLPHPHCLACQHPIAQNATQFLERMRSLQSRCPIDSHTLLEDFAHCVDARVGLFPAVDNSHFVRLPLAVYKINVSNLLPREDSPEPLTVIAASVDVREARVRAAQKACECYAANCVDQRRLLPSEAAQQSASPVISAEQLIGASVQASADQIWTWAQDLQTQQALLVPAACVFSPFCKHERGIGSGKTWEEAICKALLDWCCYLTVEHVKDAHHEWPQIDLERSCVTQEGAYLYRLLKAAGERITVYDITGPLEIPTFAVCSGTKTISYSTNYDSMQALNMGLEQAVQHYQSTHFHQPDYALRPVLDLPVDPRSNQTIVLSREEENICKNREGWLLQKLQKNGIRAFVTPLDHDPALTQVLPFIARVLLSRREI